MGLSSKTPGTGIERDRHQYISLILSCSRSVYVAYTAFLFSCRLVSFQFFLPYAFLVFAFIYLLLSFLLDMDLSRALFLARIISYWRFYLCFGFFLPLRLSFIVVFGGYFLSLVLLMLGLMSAKSRPQVQLIRAEPSSNGSSEPLSESLSKLSSHQIPHSPVSEGTTTAKGLYAKFYFVLTHYAFGSVSAQCVLFALSTPLRLRGRTGVFRRREGPPRLPISGLPFFRL